MPGRKAPLGELEHLVMLAVLQLDESAYGMAIRDEVEDRGGRSLTRGATYATISRLERKGFLDHSVAEPTGQPGGRAKRFFRVTEPGLDALRVAQRSLLRMRDGLEAILDSR